MEYSRVAPEHVYVRDNTRECGGKRRWWYKRRRRRTRRGMRGRKRCRTRRRWGTERGKVVSGGGCRNGEGDGGDGGGRRDHAALSSINLSAAVV